MTISAKVEQPSSTSVSAPNSANGSTRGSGRKVSVWRRLWKVLKFAGLAFLSLLSLVVASILWVRYWPAPPLPQSTLLGDVTNVKATNLNGAIIVTWDLTPGAINYQVLRSDKPERDYYIAGSPGGYHPGPLQFPVFWDRLVAHLLSGYCFGCHPNPPFIDSNVFPGRTYYYRVRATDSAGWTSPTAPVQLVAAEPGATPPSLRVDVDAANSIGVLQHKWETVVGSERLSYMLKEDINSNLRGAGRELRQANKMAHDELGMHYVVTHSILNDDLGVYREDAKGNAQYDFSKVDALYDNVLSDGLKPYVQLDFMPSQLASNPSATHGIFTGSSYLANDTPPKDYTKWAQLISAFATHLIGRYGKVEVESWPFAVWNEPDVCYWFWRSCYWKGTADQYYHLYDYTATALKSVDSQLRVGGPVTLSAAFVEPFLRHVTSHNYATGENSTPLDFLDVRVYMEDPANWKALQQRYGLEKIPVYYSEWGVREVEGDPVTDMAYGAAWIAHSLIRSQHNNVDVISYWTASDYMGEHGDPARFFHGGFGLIGLDGIRKSRYWAYYLLHQLGTEQLQLSGEGDGFDTLVKGWATRNDDGSVRILLSNAVDDQANAAGKSSLDRQVSLNVTGLGRGLNYRLQHYRVDNIHSNVYGVWKKMGSPVWPNQAELAKLHQGDGLETLDPETALTADSQGDMKIEFSLPMPSLSLIVLTPQRPSRSALRGPIADNARECVGCTLRRTHDRSYSLHARLGCNVSSNVSAIASVMGRRGSCSIGLQ
jgi:xylan 1,4-beta-xylosidase